MLPSARLSPSTYSPAWRSASLARPAPPKLLPLPLQEDGMRRHCACLGWPAREQPHSHPLPYSHSPSHLLPHPLRHTGARSTLTPRPPQSGQPPSSARCGSGACLRVSAQTRSSNSDGQDAPGSAGLASATTGSSSSLSSSSSGSLAERLKACGIAGVMSYGLLNTLYYLTAFLFAFLKVTPLQRGTGFLAVARHCGMLLALVWAGSQVTKVPRLLLALSLTPAIDKLLQRMLEGRRVASKGRALALMALLCFGGAAAVFLCLILLWS